MNEREWERFFDLVDLIVIMGGPWKEKRDLIVQQAEANGSAGTWDELVGWFGGNVNEEVEGG